MTSERGDLVKNDKQYQGLRIKATTKTQAPRIANASGPSKRGGN